MPLFFFYLLLIALRTMAINQDFLNNIITINQDSTKYPRLNWIRTRPAVVRDQSPLSHSVTSISIIESSANEFYINI